MRLPKGKLFALVALVVAASLVMATGAFSTVTAERSTNVKVTGDEKAFLGITPSPDSPNGQYAEQQPNGELVVNLNGKANVDGGGQGVNPDAVSSFDNVFTITNQGTQPVNVWIEDSSDRVSFYVGGDTANRPDSQGGAISVGVGDTKQVGVVVDATDQSAGTQFLSGDDDMIVHAVAPDASAPEEAADGAGSGGSSGS